MLDLHQIRDLPQGRPGDPLTLNLQSHLLERNKFFLLVVVCLVDGAVSAVTDFGQVVVFADLRVNLGLSLLLLFKHLAVRVEVGGVERVSVLRIHLFKILNAKEGRAREFQDPSIQIQISIKLNAIC